MQSYLILADLAIPKKASNMLTFSFSSGGWTRTNDLRVMSPTSYRLLYSAVWDCKGKEIFLILQKNLEIPGQAGNDGVCYASSIPAAAHWRRISSGHTADWISPM